MEYKDRLAAWQKECSRIEAFNAKQASEYFHEPLPPQPLPDAAAVTVPAVVAQVDTQDVKALAKTHTADAVKTLWEIAQDKDVPASARVAAASALLDRGHGKPAAVDEQEGELKRKRLSLEELLELRRALLSLPEKQPVIIDQT